jgi:hypothetical protein
MLNFNGQARQDEFVVNMTNRKKNGFFLEIGSMDPVKINNSYILEKEYGWTGIMVEYDKKWLSHYKEKRPNSIHVMEDATKIDYKTLFEENNVPLNSDYLQIDLEVNDGGTLRTLNKLKKDVLGKYKFATITFEHDIYHTNFLNTRFESRKIFEDLGYLRIFSDVNSVGGSCPFEDWYIHPELVDLEYVFYLLEKNVNNYKNIKQRKFKDSPVDKTICCKNIEYK